MKKIADSNQWSEIPNDVLSNIISAAESRIAIFLCHPYAQNGKTVYKRVSLLSIESILKKKRSSLYSLMKNLDLFRILLIKCHLWLLLRVFFEVQQ
jgi:hypothetical protein